LEQDIYFMPDAFLTLTNRIKTLNGQQC